MKIENNLDTYISFWKDEMTSATMYRTFSEIEKDKRLAEVYKRMSENEIKHAKHWEEKITETGGKIPEFKMDMRTKIQLWLARKFGSSVVLPGVISMENEGNNAYMQLGGIADMARDENSHARIINQISGTVKGGFDGGAIAMLEGRHRSGGGNALRAAVLGANDGLVSNLSLVMGVAGAALESKSILITGLAGMLAGAISMALGEWLSVQSSRELFSNQISIEETEIENNPEEEAEELALIYEARGLARDQAVMLAGQIMKNPESAKDTLAREELGINPEELGGSAWEASITSFFLFAIGAVIPVLPFIFWNGMTAVVISIIFSTFGLFILGAMVTLYTGQKVLFSGARMVIFGLIAAAVTYGIGSIIGVGLH